MIFFTIPFLCAFSTIHSFPKPLSPTEESECIYQMQHGSDSESLQAKHKLILHNLRLVAHIAKKYQYTQQTQEELLSIGVIGLIKALLSYNTEKSIRLATYASRCIENEILMSLRTVKKYQNDISLHEPIGTDRDGNEIVMLDVITCDTPDFAEQLDFSIKSRKMIQAVQDILSEREKHVIIMRYGLWDHEPLTQQEIAAQLGISRSYISRIEKKALKKLNAALKE